MALRVLLGFVFVSFTTCFNFGGVHHVTNRLSHGLYNRHYQPLLDSVNDPADLYFTGAVLDHFRPEVYPNWSQRYFENDTYWGGPGYPIFLMIGGEGPISARDVNGGLYMSDLAKEHRALQVTVEHRFYGKSFPTADMSTDNLRFLHSEQALGDLVMFYDYYVALKNAPTSPWVAFGGSYPGCLAAWFRLKFPHIAIGSIASSGPVNTAVDFYAYMDVVEYSLNRAGGEKCTSAIRNSATAIEQLLATSSGRAQLKTIFNLCDDIVTDADVATFQGQLMGNVQGVAQYSGDGAPKPRPNVEELCQIASSQPNPVQVLKVLQDVYGGLPAGQCLDTSYNSSLAAISNSTFDLDGNSNYRQWTFQTCNQFGMFQTTTSPNKNSFNAFAELNLTYYEKLCFDAFGINRAPYAAFSNSYYGADHIAGTNILFPNGNIDPWHALGVINSTHLTQPTEQAVFIDGTAHCADMYKPQDNDLPSLKFARTQIAGAIQSWLTPYKKKHDS